MDGVYLTKDRKTSKSSLSDRLLVLLFSVSRSISKGGGDKRGTTRRKDVFEVVRQFRCRDNFPGKDVSTEKVPGTLVRDGTG